MLRHIENIDYRFHEFNRIVSAASISIFFDISSRPIFVLEGVDFIFLDSNAGNKKTSYERGQID